MARDRVWGRRRFLTTGGAFAGVWFADNPGPRMRHCHNTHHLEAGMATTLVHLA